MIQNPNTRMCKFGFRTYATDRIERGPHTLLIAPWEGPGVWEVFLGRTDGCLDVSLHWMNERREEEWKPVQHCIYTDRPIHTKLTPEDISYGTWLAFRWVERQDVGQEVHNWEINEHFGNHPEHPDLGWWKA